MQQWVGLITEIMNVKSWIVLKQNHFPKQMTNIKLGVAKLQLAFWCNELWKVYSSYVILWSLQDISSLLLIGMTGAKVTHCI